MKKKALGETQTLRAGCIKAERKIFDPPQTHSGGAGRPKFNQLEMVTTFTYTNPVTQFGEDRCTQFRVYCGNRPTNKQTNTHTHTHTHTYTHTHTHTQTHRQDRLQQTAPQLR